MKGIYIIKNLINNKVYIGSSKNIEYRIYEHKIKLSGNYHINKHLQSSFNKHGIENFNFELLKEVPESILRKAEQYYINKYNSDNPKKGYNKAVVISNFSDFKNSNKKVNKNTIYFGCYSKVGKLIKVFRNIEEVYYYLNNKNTRVYEACNSNFTKTCKGLYWLKLDVSKEKFPINIIPIFRKGRHRSIDQLDLNNNLIKTWNSAVEAGKELKFSSFNITRCLSKNNLYKGFKWQYSPVNE